MNDTFVDRLKGNSAVSYALGFLARKFPEPTFPTAEKLAPGATAMLAGLVASSVVTAVAFLVILPKNPGAHHTQEAAAALEAESAEAGNLVLPPHPQESDFKSILGRNIFNSEGTIGDNPQGNSQCQLKASDLPFKLTGLIYGGSARASLLVLESNTSKQADTFVLGDSLPGGAAVISDIERDRVIFKRNGCPEFLTLVEPKLPEGQRQHRTRCGKGAKGANCANAPVASSGTGFTHVEDGFENIEGKVRVTPQWVNRALTTNFAETLQDAKADPNIVGGKVQGFVLTRIRPNSVYEKLGLQDGDVVESINGIPLNDIGGAIQTLNQMRNETQLKVNYRRAGSPMALDVQVR